MKIVVVEWPGDPDRHAEVYGPFEHSEALDWSARCEAAAAEGWRLLQGATFSIQQVSEPFDPSALWEITGDAMRSA